MFHSRLDKGLTGGDAANDTRHTPAPLDLQAIRAIVTKTPGIEQIVAIAYKFVATRHLYSPLKSLKFAFTSPIRNNRANPDK